MNFHEKVIEEFDSPFFLYDLDGLDAHLKAISSVLHPEVKVWYACKANPLSEILRTLKANGFGVDVASMGELAQAQNAEVTDLIATGPAKSKKYLEKLIDGGVSTIVIESLNQLHDLNMAASQRGFKQDVLLRVQLEWSDDVKSVLGGSSITPFGLGLEDWMKVDVHQFKSLNIRGLHCFQWGNILNMDQLNKIWDLTIEQCRKLAGEMSIELQVLDLGGGLGISYIDDKELSFPEVHELLMKFKTKYALKEIWLELGRYTVAKFGSYFTKVVDVKSVRGKNLVISEGGINHLARPALVGETFPCFALQDSSDTKQFSIHGPLCTALDFFGDHHLPENLQPGDWLEFRKVGAYGFTESMPYFLCHDLPIEAFIKGGDLILARKPEMATSWMV